MTRSDTPRINLYLDMLDLSEVRALCLERGRERTYMKGEAFLSDGDVPRELGFVADGYFKYVVHTKSGAERVLGFSFSDDYIGNINHSLLGLPSGVTVVSGAVSRIHVVTMDEFVDFASAKGLRYCAGILAALFHTFYMRYIDLYRLSPTERYEQVLRQWPEVLQKVPLRDIASYLGITPIHLSRLRRRMYSR